MIDLETAKCFYDGDKFYLVVIEDDHVHGVGKELWVSNDEGFDLVGMTAVGFPIDIPSEVLEFCQKDITENEFNSWKRIQE